MAAYLIDPQLFTLTLRQPVWTRPPLAPWLPSTPIYTDAIGGVYTDTTGTETVAGTGATTNIVADVTFLQPGKPVIGDFMMLTSKVNYWYVDAELKIKFSLPGHPADEFQRGIDTYAGIYQGQINTFIGSNNTKRVRSFLVKIKMPYNAAGSPGDTDYLLWIGGESAFGTAAEKQFELGGNGYGNTGSVTPGTGSPTGTTNTETITGTNMKWVIIIAIIFLWVLKK